MYCACHQIFLVHAIRYGYNAKELMQSFVDNGGQILACGMCLKLRKSQGSAICPLSTMKDLYELIRDCDRVVSI